MSVRTSHRMSAGVAPLIAAGLLLSACGGGDGEAASRPTVTLAVGETSYETLPVATTPAPVEEASTEEEDTSGAQEYTVKAGDYGILIADRFGVSLQDLENVNGWSDASREFPGPGTVIKIPAGGTNTESTANDTGGGSTDPDDDADTDVDTAGDAEVDPGETGEAIPEVGSNCEPGSYTIEDDVRTRFEVAEKFDVTVEAMDAANSGTNGYDAFYPGLEIIIPAKDGC